MASNFHRVLPLLEALDDQALDAWGRTFDWSIPEVDVMVYKGYDGCPELRTFQYVQPATSLLVQGSARLKRLLIRPDMFGKDELPLLNKGERNREGKNLASRSDLWTDLWTTAWARGDTEVIDRIRHWVPIEALEPLTLSGDEAFLEAWARRGEPGHVAALMRRMKTLVESVPAYTLAYRGRKQVSTRAAMNHWMGIACCKAVGAGRLEWLEAVLREMPGLAKNPRIAGKALESGQFDLGRRLLDGMVEKPKLGDRAPESDHIRIESSPTWLDSAVKAWEKAFFPNESPGDDALLTEAASWIASGFGAREMPDAEAIAHLHEVATGHGQWGPEWVGFLDRHGIPVNSHEIESMARNVVAPHVVAARLVGHPPATAEEWANAITQCLRNGRTAAAGRVAKWGGRYSGMPFPHCLAHLPEADVLQQAWIKEQSLVLEQNLPSARKTHAAARL